MNGLGSNWLMYYIVCRWLILDRTGWRDNQLKFCELIVWVQYQFSIIKTSVCVECNHFHKRMLLMLVVVG